MQSDIVENEARESQLPYILTPQQAYDALTSSTPSTRTIAICASWFWGEEALIPSGFTGLDAFTAQHIPHALFWDFDAVRDTDSQLMHTIPSAARMASATNAIGIAHSDRLIIYDSAELGLFTAPRVAWLLRTFGYPHVHIMDNFHLWLQQGLPFESGPPLPALDQPPQKSPSNDPVEPKPQSTLARLNDIRALSSHSATADAQLIDARFESMFRGQVPDWVPGIPSGHIPNALNVPWDRLRDPATKGLRSVEELTELFTTSGVAREAPAVSMCHVGITAVLLDAALEKAGFGGTLEKRKIYDGSYA
ncbi:hypothetical protein MMC07_003153 [Pseudocyphellaria aurata]|nr:hypothetical protein [Pseudocyphellaria aurata]